MRILVTGGLGHIGSNLIRSLNEYELIVVDDFMTQRYASLFNLSLETKIDFHEKRVQDITEEWLRKVGPIDVIVHLSATTDASGNANNREALFESDENFWGETFTRQRP